MPETERQALLLALYYWREKLVKAERITRREGDEAYYRHTRAAGARL